MVIKENLNYRHWHYQRQWRERLPREVKVHQLIEEGRNDGPGFDNLVKFRAYRLMMRQKRMRLYLDFYRGGDLFDATRPLLRVSHQIPENQRVPGGPMYDLFGLRYGEESLLPEAFLWEAFRDLVNACLAMQRGDVNGAKEGWKRLTHMDLSINNVMLDVDEKDWGVSSPFPRKHYRLTSKTQWPKLVVGDFGFTFYDISATRGSEISDNPQCYQAPGADLRYPPVCSSRKLRLL
jgi:hypothetical protein